MGKLADVNTTDIRDVIQLGCDAMSRLFNTDDNNMPYQRTGLLPETDLRWSPTGSEAHVPGRHLNALLSAEDAAGIDIDEDAVGKHARALYFSHSGPVPFPMNRAEVGGPLANFTPHSLREAFHAFYALVRYRGDGRAAELADRSLDAIFRLWNPTDGWNLAELQDKLGIEVRNSEFFINGLARSIGPLVKCFRATGCERALELAIVLKEKALAEYYREDGAYSPDAANGHVHSTTSTLSSLAQLADLTSDSVLMDHVRTFYDNGLWELRDELGWAIENVGNTRDPDRGEVNSTGDIVETALILGRWGYTQYYEDAERILRCHLLPSQLRDVSFIREPENPEGIDGKRDVARRLRGSFGFPAPWGHDHLGPRLKGFHMDIVGGAVGSLCEAYREIVSSEGSGHYVTLHFDHETPAVAVESPYTHDSLRVRVRRPGPLFVRIPSWVDREELTLSGTSETPRFTNGYVLIPRPPLNRWIGIGFPLVEQEITLKHRTREIRVRLRGDEVTAMDNFGADWTFFDPID